jgi:hypothetical protein
MASCPSQADINGLKSQVIGILSQPSLGLNNPDVRPQCQVAPSGASVLSMLIWGTEAKDAREEQARDAATVPDEIFGSTFGVFVTRSLIVQLAQAQFAQLPSPPIPDQPSIHLTDISVDFDRPNIIETHIKGYDDRPTPVVHFTTTITDTLIPRANNCNPLIDPSCGCTTRVKNDITTFDVIMVLGLLSAGGPYFAGDLNAIINQPHGPSQAGVGCRLYQSLPSEIALPQTPLAIRNPNLLPLWQRNKLRIQFLGAPQVDPPSAADQAVVFTGVPELPPVPRTPMVQIVGPSDVSIDLHDLGTSASYAVVTWPPGSKDFFGDLTYTWSGDPNHVRIVDAQSCAGINFIGDAKPCTDIIFIGDPNMQPGSHITQTITVRVTDVEGSSAMASMNVVVTKADSNPVTPPPPPPQCGVHPELPECQTHPL